MVARKGLAWLAITDHDTVAGLEEAGERAGRVGIGFVPGVELSVDFRDQDFHILAYWIAPADPELTRLLEQASRSRVERARRILTLLHPLGLTLRMEEVERQALLSRSLGRAHIARALVESGQVGTFAEAFDRYLGCRAPAYVPKETVDPVRALTILRGAGGVPVLAHPGIYRLEGALEVLLQGGLAGIETEHPTHTAEQAANLRRLATRHGLVATGGSDFHGGDSAQSLIGTTKVEARTLDELYARR